MEFTREDVIDFIADHIEDITRKFDQDTSSRGVSILTNDTRFSVALNHSFTKKETKPRHLALLENQAFRDAAANEVRSNFADHLNQCYIWKGRCWRINVQCQYDRDE
jgi:hypothetical protein